MDGPGRGLPDVGGRPQNPLDVAGDYMHRRRNLLF